MSNPYTCYERSGLKLENVEWVASSRCPDCGHLMISHAMASTGACDICDAVHTTLQALREVTSAALPEVIVPEDSILSLTPTPNPPAWSDEPPVAESPERRSAI